MAARDQHDPEQVRHDDIGQLIPTEEQERRARGQCRDRGGRQVARDIDGTTDFAFRERPLPAHGRPPSRTRPCRRRRTIWSTSEGRKRSRSRYMVGLPTMIFVMLRSRAKRRISSVASLSADRVTTSAPSCSASLRFWDGEPARSSRAVAHFAAPRTPRTSGRGAPKRCGARGANQACRVRARAHGDEDLIGGGPCLLDTLRPAVGEHLGIDAVGGVAQREARGARSDCPS